MARVGLLSFSDGRDFVHADIKTFSLDVESRIAQALEAAGHEVIRAAEPIWTNTMASTEARRVADARPALTIFNYAVWAFPHFSMLAAAATPGPLLLFSNIDPQFPGMVGMLAAGGGLDQVGRQHTRVWGDVADSEVRDRVLETVRAAAAVSKLSGSTFGRFGGRPMGMYTAVADTDQWMSTFG
ncbi:MAG: fucose isomerase, partial [Pseudonocardiaceae bacterium]